MSNDPETLESGKRISIARMFKISLVLLGLVIGAVALTAWLSGAPDVLPFAYDGFD